MKKSTQVLIASILFIVGYVPMGYGWKYPSGLGSYIFILGVLMSLTGIAWLFVLLVRKILY